MDFVVLIGRVFLGALAVGSGLGGHFGATDATAGYGDVRGVPSARVMVLVSGVVLVAAGASIILGVYPDAGALLFVGYLLAANFMVHRFWNDDDPMVRQMEMTQFMKNLAIAGGCLLAFAYFQTAGDDAPFQFTGTLF